MNTQKSEKKNIKWFRTIRPIALALVLVLLLSYATYSWMKRDWTPTLREDNVRIVAGSSLVFLFGDDEVEDVAINELEGMGDFVFKSVSNASGASDDFFALNYSPKGEYYDRFKHLSVDEVRMADGDDLAQEEPTSVDYMMLGKKYGYVELTFKVKAPAGENEKDKLIMLSSESCINAAMATKTEDVNAVKAMRVSITVPDSSNNNQTTKTIIFAPNGTQHKGITNKFVDGVGYVADSVYRYVNGTTVLEQKAQDGSGLVIAPSEQNSVNTENRVLPLTSSETLFTLKAGTMEELVVRIWLEGEDVNCTDDKILGGELDLLMKFEASDIE